MLKAIKLSLDDSDKAKLKQFDEPDEQNIVTYNRLEKYIGANSVINGTKLSENWFPEMSTDIFISHSHKNENVALGLKAFIETKTKHKCFVDSSVWGKANSLLKEIDNKCCKSGLTTYDYTQRNYSTSHVYLMLNVALQKMIFKSQSVIFLDTPQSVSVKDTVDKKTNSPWIYSEISTVMQICKMQQELETELRKSLLGKEKEIQEEFSSPKIEYSIDFSDFEEVNSLKDLVRALN